MRTNFAWPETKDVVRLRLVEHGVSRSGTSFGPVVQMGSRGGIKDEFD